VTVGDPVRLSRRDRAACRMAYECLRQITRRDLALHALDNARQVLYRGDETAEAIADGPWTVHDVFDYRDDPRRLRGLMATLLRAILRADAGDYGRERHRCVKGCVTDHCKHLRFDAHRCYYVAEPPDFLLTRRYTPLWEMAGKR
jgi:hypothetical protein